jgi:hypothetical protein
VKEKAHKVERIPVASEVAKGKYAVGFQQVSELLPVPGVTVIGELPDNAQYITRFAGTVTANAEHRQEGKALLDFLSSPRAQKTIHATGMRAVKVEQPTAVCSGCRAPLWLTSCDSNHLGYIFLAQQMSAKVYLDTFSVLLCIDKCSAGITSAIYPCLSVFSRKTLPA